MDQKGSLIVLSGFSGVGKGTVTRMLIDQYGYKLSISATTRAPRPGEVDGKDYFFMSQDDFLKLVDQNGFIEYAQYVKNYYGTPRKFVEDSLAAGDNVILEIEVQGALSIKKQYPEAILIFITAPCAQALKDRLINRGSETMEVIEQRLHRAVAESDLIRHYDYIVCNENGAMEQCMEDIHNIILSEKKKIGNQADFIEQLRQNIAAYES